MFELFLVHCCVWLQDLEYDRRLQDVPRLLPTSLNLPGITATEYCVNYVHQLRSVLAQCPPNQPTETAIDMLVAVAQLQRWVALPGWNPGFCRSLNVVLPKSSTLTADLALKPPAVANRHNQCCFNMLSCCTSTRCFCHGLLCLQVPGGARASCVTRATWLH